MNKMINLTFCIYFLFIAYKFFRRTNSIDKYREIYFNNKIGINFQKNYYLKLTTNSVFCTRFFFFFFFDLLLFIRRGANGGFTFFNFAPLTVLRCIVSSWSTLFSLPIYQLLYIFFLALPQVSVRIVLLKKLDFL